VLVTISDSFGRIRFNTNIYMFYVHVHIESQHKASGLNLALETHRPRAVVLTIDLPFAVSVNPRSVINDFITQSITARSRYYSLVALQTAY
jgi:hypothetical protein